VEVRRLPGNPIIRPAMLPGNDGGNINGPSLICATSRLTHRLEAYVELHISFLMLSWQ
jgi:hypothetical protein